MFRVFLSKTNFIETDNTTFAVKNNNVLSLKMFMKPNTNNVMKNALLARGHLLIEIWKLHQPIVYKTKTFIVLVFCIYIIFF